jgi:hypothetical protein
MRRFIKELELF